MQKMTFSSDMLPSDLNPEQRARAWANVIGEGGGQADIAIPEKGRFFGAIEFFKLDRAMVARTSATSLVLQRRHAHISRDGCDSLMLLICTGMRPVGGSQFGREVLLPRGGAALFVNNHINSTFAHRGGSVVAATLPRSFVSGIKQRPEDAASTLLTPENKALRMMRGYIESVLEGNEPLQADLAATVSEHLGDLLQLALGATGDAREMAEQRGVRAARLAAIEIELRRHFTEPSLTPDHVASSLGISARYLQQLLYDQGTSFRARVTELRLQYAWDTLSGPAALDQSIADIAFTCGFAEVSTFHRAFRARFGDTPAGVRTTHWADHSSSVKGKGGSRQSRSGGR